MLKSFVITYTLYFFRHISFDFIQINFLKAFNVRKQEQINLVSDLTFIYSRIKWS